MPRQRSRRPQHRSSPASTPSKVSEKAEVSAERYLARGAVVSVAVALVASRIPVLRFGTIIAMVCVLVAADVVVYALMKVGLFERR